MQGQRPTAATIDLDALRANAAEARRLAQGRDLIAVVKADAYGHGAVPVVRALLEAGCRRLAVLSVSEAAELREAAVAAPILVLGGVHDAQEADRALALRVTPVLHSADNLRCVSEAAKRARVRAPVQVEVDTGMCRMGVALDAAVSVFEAVADDEGLSLEGVFTHLARADEPDPAASLEQLGRFRRILHTWMKRAPAPSVIHALNSAGLLAGAALADALPEATAVRPGLLLYGVRPTPTSAQAARLTPCMRFHTRVTLVRRVAPGESVGYGGTFRPARKTRVALLPVGYADGVPWSSGGRGRVWLGGAARPIAGRVSMDYTAVDIGEDPVSAGDEAVIFGVGRDGGIPVEEAARAAGTISYELLARVGRRVPRQLESTRA